MSNYFEIILLFSIAQIVFSTSSNSVQRLPSFCGQFLNSYECAVNECQWIKDKCYKVSKGNLRKKMKSISFSLPTNSRWQNSQLDNCSSNNSTDSIKCSWKIKPYSPDHSLAVNLTQNLEGEFIFGFHVKYYNGKKKSHLIYKESNEDSKKGNFYDLGSNIQEIVFELISFDKVLTDMFNAEIIFNNKRKSTSFFTQDIFIYFILIGSFIFFLFFLFGLIGIFIKKYKERRLLQKELIKRNLWRISKQKELKLFIKKNFTLQSIEEIENKTFTDNTCPICLDDFEAKKVDLVQLRCQHIYHSKCIDDWMMEKYSNPFCPICHDIICKNDFSISNVDVNEYNLNENLL